MIKQRKIIAFILLSVILLINIPNAIFASSNKTPTLNAYQLGNNTKLEWAIEMDDIDVLIQTSFEDGEIDGIKLLPFPLTYTCYYEEGESYGRVYNFQKDLEMIKYDMGEHNINYFRQGNGINSGTNINPRPTNKLGEKFSVYYKFKDGSERLEYRMYTNGELSISTAESYHGNKSVRIGKTTPVWGNNNRNNATQVVADNSYFGFERIKGIENGTDLSVTFRAKGTKNSTISPAGIGGRETRTYDVKGPKGLPLIVAQYAPKGSTKIYLNNLEQFPDNYGNTIYFATEKLSGEMSPTFGTGTIREINKEKGYVILSRATTEDFPVGYVLQKHGHFNPVTFNRRSLSSNDEWETFSINTKVRDNPYYDTGNRGFDLRFTIKSFGEVYIDDLKFGYATKAELYRDGAKIYEGFLSDYDDKAAIDKAKPNKITSANLSMKDGKAILDIDRPKDNGTKYTYQVMSVNHQGGKTPSVKKDVTITTGVKGYSYVLDKNPNTVPDNKINEATDSIKVPINSNEKYYLHVRTIDGQGNASEVTHYEIQDNVAPELTLSASKITPTNEDVIITANANDSGLGVKKIELPNGNIVQGNKAIFTVKANGEYNFTAEDYAGNKTTKTIKVTNIDKVLPIITVEPYNTNWTNKDITVNAKVDKGTLNKNSHTFTKNGSFEFIATDVAGNIAKKTININNIDKIPPTKPVVNRVDNKLILTKATDNESGIDKHMYSLDDGEWAIWTNDIDISNLPDGNHIVKVKAIDKATNETETSFSFSTEYEAIKDINKAIENLNSLDESIIDGIQNAIDNIKNSETKNELQNKLNEKVKWLKEQEATKAVEKARNTLSENDYNKAMKLVNELHESSVKDELMEALNQIKELMETKKEQDDIKDSIDNSIIDDDIDLDELDESLDELQDRIDNLPDGEEKSKLQDELDKLREQLQIEANKRLKEATRAVELAEATRREPYIQKAKDKVTKLKEGPDKEALEDRIKAIGYIDQDSVDIKDAELAVKLAEATKREPYISRAKAKVRELAFREEKNSLESRLFSLEETINSNDELTLKNAERIVSLAEKLKRETNLLSARDAINRLKPSEEKTNFLIRLEKVAKDIEGKELTDDDIAIIKATYYVELAETYDYEFMIRKAMEEVEKLPEGQDKQSLSNRLNSLNI